MLNFINLLTASVTMPGGTNEVAHRQLMLFQKLLLKLLLLHQFLVCRWAKVEAQLF